MNGNRYGSVSIDAHEDNNSKTSQTLVIRRPSTEVQEVHFSVCYIILYMICAHMFVVQYDVTTTFSSI